MFFELVHFVGLLRPRDSMIRFYRAVVQRLRALRFALLSVDFSMVMRFGLHGTSLFVERILCLLG